LTISQSDEPISDLILKKKTRRRDRAAIRGKKATRNRGAKQSATRAALLAAAERESEGSLVFDQPIKADIRERA
jgi:hypothetical protein